MLILANSMSFYKGRKRKDNQRKQIPAKGCRKEVSAPSSQFLACLGASFCQERGNFEVNTGTLEKYAVI